MLQVLRSGLRSLWIRVILIGLLVASFALWGATDLLRSTAREEPLVYLEGAEIHAHDFRYRLDQYAYELTSRGFTPRAFFRDPVVLRRLLDSLVQETVLDLEAQEQGFILSPETLHFYLASNPEFQNETGQLDRARLESWLRRTGTSSEAFLESQRRQILSRRLDEVLLLEQAFEGELVKALARQNIEERSGVAWRFAPVALELPDPSESQLTDHMAAYPERFQRPELRRVRMLELKTEALRTQVRFTEDELRAWFEENADQFAQPERRSYQTYLAQTEEAIRDVLISGTLEEGKAEYHTRVQRDAILDPALAEAVFSSQPGLYPEPVAGTLGWFAVEIVDITPALNPTLEDVRTEAEKQLLDGKIDERLFTLLDQVEDLLLSETLEKVAETYEAVTLREFWTSARGLDENFLPLEDLPRQETNAGQESFLQIVFQTAPGTRTDFIRSAGSNSGSNSGDNYWMVEMQATDDARPLRLEEAREQVRASWQLEARLEATQETLEAFLPQLETSGANWRPPAGQPTSFQFERNDIATLRRHTQDVPEPVRETFFQLETGKAESLVHDGRVWLVYLEGVRTPELSEESLENALFSVTQPWLRALQEERSDMLRAHYDVRFNERAIAIFLADY